VLAAACACAVLPVASAAAFPDVSSELPASDAIQYLTSAKVISGYEDGTFRPEINLNRGQAAKILVLQNGLQPAAKVGSTFKDLEAVYGRYVETAASRGWIGGYADGTFRTYDSMQRQHMAAVVAKSLGWEQDARALSTAQVAAILKGFPDFAQVSAEARPYMALAVSRGLFAGDAQGRLKPTDGITRAQFALVAYRAELSRLTVVEGVRASSNHPDKTRVVFDLSSAPTVSLQKLAGSSVLTIELTRAAVSGLQLDATVAGSDEVQACAARQLSHRPQNVRLSVTLKRFSRYEVSVIGPSDGLGHRLVVDIFRRNDGPPGDGPPLVCLDAGHGGSDSGAVGVTDLKEKDINLTLTLLVDQMLRDAGLRTVLTRDSDTYPTLRERAQLANQAQATIFVSIHNNAHPGYPGTSGTETFYQGTPDKYSAEGRKLAEAIQRNLIATIQSKDRGAKTHWNRLVVLNETNMPAALTEVGFLTSPEEEAKLRDPEYVLAAAEGIANGILEYLGWPKIA
jgi:N-acetylmuramoyl-L-alanine amidase